MNEMEPHLRASREMQLQHSDRAFGNLAGTMLAVSSHSTICIAEDRKDCEPALRLLLASLNKHCGGLSINVFYPLAGAEFLEWSKQFPQVTIHIVSLPGACGWNVKPHALLSLLDQGYDEVIWIDTDIIVADNIGRHFDRLGPDTVVVTQEALWGTPNDFDGLRARLWGFRVARILPCTLNSAVVRTTKSHYALLMRWRELLESEKYQSAQRRGDRPLHMLGDQDVLTALLCSADYAHIPIKMLERGTDILQYFGLYGFTSLERIRTLVFGTPSFVHSQGSKPWIECSYANNAASFRKLRKYVEALYMDLSPYTLAARSFKSELPHGASWMQPHSTLSAILRAVGLWYPPLVGLPIALIVDLIRLANAARRRRTGAVH